MMPTPDTECRSHGAGRITLMTVAVVAVATAGYSGYALYPRFDLPAASGAGLLALAVAAGIASFFSPCSFPLLATLLTRSGNDTSGLRWQHIIRNAAALALGASIFLVLTGVLLGLGAGALFGDVIFTSDAGRAIRTTVGILLVALGAAQLGYIRVPFFRIANLMFPVKQTQARLRRERPVFGFTLHGFTYVVAGFG